MRGERRPRWWLTGRAGRGVGGGLRVQQATTSANDVERLGSICLAGRMERRSAGRSGDIVYKRRRPELLICASQFVGAQRVLTVTAGLLAGDLDRVISLSDREQIVMLLQ